MTAAGFYGRTRSLDVSHMLNITYHYRCRRSLLRWKTLLRPLPVGVTSVASTQMGRLGEAETLAADEGFVHINAEPWRVGDDVVASIKTNLNRKDICSVEAELFDGRRSTFKP